VGANAQPFRRADANQMKVMELNTQSSERSCRAAAATYAAIRRFALMAIALNLLLSGVIGWLLTRAIVPPLLNAAEVLEAVAGRDLTHTVSDDSLDEIGRMSAAVNTAVETLRALLRSMQRSVETLSSAAVELSTTADKSVEDAERQCSETNQIASATQEMAATIAEVSRNAAQANMASQDAAHTAAQGGEALRKTVLCMNDISDFTQQTVQKMASLAHRAEQIGQVVVTIREISDQTNLLALNAAIEAQRAGDQGRGFAVVAGEVRRLAERTKVATGEIAETIATIQGETRETLKLIESGKAHVAAGLTESEGARHTLDTIIDLAHRSEEQIGLIAAASTEEAAASSEISRAIGNISQLSANVAQAAQETTRASHGLSELAADLEREVATFRLTEDATSAPHLLPKRPRSAAA
jgi:methyl-accepting chemotaxis protein